MPVADSANFCSPNKPISQVNVEIDEVERATITDSNIRSLFLRNFGAIAGIRRSDLRKKGLYTTLRVLRIVHATLLKNKEYRHPAEVNNSISSIKGVVIIGANANDATLVSLWAGQPWIRKCGVRSCCIIGNLCGPFSADLPWSSSHFWDCLLFRCDPRRATIKCNKRVLRNAGKATSIDLGQDRSA